MAGKNASPSGQRTSANAEAAESAAKRHARLRQWAANAQRNPGYWAEAIKAARDVRTAVTALIDVVGRDVASDYLAMSAAALRAAKRGVKPRRSALLPSITGRHARDPVSDTHWKERLLNPPRDPKGKPATVKMMALWLAKERGISIDAARRHLTMLKREAKLEAAAALPSVFPGLNDARNALAVMARRAPPKCEK